MNQLKKVFVLTFAVSLGMLSGPKAEASVGSALVKSIGGYMAKEAGETAAEQAVKQMTKQVGEELIQRTAAKILKEGGEKTLAEVGELVAKHGPDVIRALDNVADPLPVIRMLQELPADQVASAAARLAAGVQGQELATLSARLGASVLRAETQHPGVGMSFARSLGKEGSELAMQLTQDQAMQIGRHVDAIAKLPAAQQQGVMELIRGNADRFAIFVGRFVEQNPGKVLFTSAATAIVLSNDEQILGGSGQIVMDADGNPVFVAEPGLLDRMADRGTEVVKDPIAQVASAISWLFYTGALLVLAGVGMYAYSYWCLFGKPFLRRLTNKQTGEQA